MSFHLSVWQNTLKGTREFSHSVGVMSLRLLYYYFYVTLSCLLYLWLSYNIYLWLPEKHSNYSIQIMLAVGCEHTGCKSCYGQDLELGGFTMPSLGNPYHNAIHFH